MFGRKTDSRINRVAGSVARGAVIASLALSLSPVPALAAAGTGSPSGITLLAEAETGLPPAEADLPPVEGTIQADAPVEFNAETAKIVGTGDAPDNFSDWYERLTVVEVGLGDQAGGAVQYAYNVIEGDGSINTLAKASSAEDAGDIFDESGTYHVVVHSDTFKDLEFDIEVKTPPIKYDDTAIALVDPDGNIEDYTAAITKVTINGDVSIVNGNPEVILPDGTIDTEAVFDYGDGQLAFVFDQDVNRLVVSAPGYKDLEVTVDIDAAQTVYRLYNPFDHLRLYTTDQAEYEGLVSLGWNGEGVAWSAPRVSHDGQHVYRLYNQYNGEHLYTTDLDEYDELGEVGWTQEGVAFESASGGSESVAVRRYYNPYITGTGSTHHYTADEAEQAEMVAAGWVDEGVAFYGVV